MANAPLRIVDLPAHSCDAARAMSLGLRVMKPLTDRGFMKAPNAELLNRGFFPNKSSGPIDAGALPDDRPPTRAEDC